MDLSNKQKFIQNSIFFFLLFLWAYAGIKILFPVTLPFWFGLTVALLLKPITLWLSRHLRFRRKSAAFSVLLLFYLILGLLLWASGSVLYRQFNVFLAEIPTLYGSNIQPFFHRCALTINGVLDDFSPQTAKAIVEKSNELSGSLSTTIADFSASALTQATSWAKKIPFWLLTVAFSILCSVFISMDYGSVAEFLLLQLPSKWRPVFLRCKQQLLNTVLQILKAYLILLVITFLQLLFGFFLLRIKNPFLWATVIALLDFLPFIGTAFVLIPWGIYSLLMGRGALGAGLLILCAILTLVHNLLEPKLVSSSTGLHPLATLVSMYAGLKLFGIAGLLLAPAVVLLFCFMQQEGLIRIFHEK